jgi:hypothetical protein
MFSLNLPVPDGLARDLLNAAIEASMPLDDFVIRILQNEVTMAGEISTSACDVDIDRIVAAMFATANSESIGSSFSIVQLYTKTFNTSWELLATGTRKSLGKRFMKVVRESPAIDLSKTEWKQVQFMFKTVQNTNIFQLTGPGVNPGYDTLPKQVAV